MCSRASEQLTSQTHRCLCAPLHDVIFYRVRPLWIAPVWFRLMVLKLQYRRKIGPKYACTRSTEIVDPNSERYS